MLFDSKLCSSTFFILKYKKPPSASQPNNPLGGANKLYNHCVNNLLNIKAIIVNKSFMLTIL